MTSNAIAITKEHPYSLITREQKRKTCGKCQYMQAALEEEHMFTTHPDPV